MYIYIYFLQVMIIIFLYFDKLNLKDIIIFFLYIGG